MQENTIGLKLLKIRLVVKGCRGRAEECKEGTAERERAQNARTG